MLKREGRQRLVNEGAGTGLTRPLGRRAGPQSAGLFGSMRCEAAGLGTLARTRGKPIEPSLRACVARVGVGVGRRTDTLNATPSDSAPRPRSAGSAGEKVMSVNPSLPPLPVWPPRAASKAAGMAPGGDAGVAGGASAHRCRLLERCALAGMSASAVAELGEQMVHQHRVRKGHVVHRAGQLQASVGVVNSGCFKSSLTLHGHSQVVGFQIPGDFLALEALAQEHHACEAQALEMATVCSVEAACFADWLARERPLRAMVWRAMSQRLVHAGTQMLLLSQMTAEERVLAFLTEWTTRAHALGYSSHTMLLSMARHDIASYLGLSVETVSRTLSVLKRRHWLLVEGRDISVLHTMPKAACLA